MELYMDGKTPVFDLAAGILPGEMHLSYGQEAVAAMCENLTENDWVHAGHRPHAIAIACGVDLKGMAAELLGKKEGLSGGRGGHMHIYDRSVNFASSSIIGEQMPAAVGFAMAAKARGDNSIAVSLIGDGAANQGTFHESLNFAAVQKLPYVCIVEDNNWAVTTSKAQSTAIARNSDRAAAYGIPGEYVEGNNLERILEATGKAFDYVREGNGPFVLEIETFRMMGHFHPDPAPMVPQEEKDSWVDCVAACRESILLQGVLPEAELEQLETEVIAEVEDALTFAIEADYPAPEEALERVFASN